MGTHTRSRRHLFALGHAACRRIIGTGRLAGDNGRTARLFCSSKQKDGCAADKKVRNHGLLAKDRGLCTRPQSARPNEGLVVDEQVFCDRRDDHMPT
jgi:hypothetical protein